MFQIQLGSGVKTYLIFRMHHKREKAVHKAARKEGIFLMPPKEMGATTGPTQMPFNERTPQLTKVVTGLSICISNATIARTIQIDDHAKIGLL